MRQPLSNWEQLLAQMGGHPLQSALWGEARQKADGIEDHRWVAFIENTPLFMARFETRRILGIGKVAWLPKGPTASSHPAATMAHSEFIQGLRKLGYLLCFEAPYSQSADSLVAATAEPTSSAPRTVWIDLRQGREALWAKLDKQWRYGVGAARRAGVVVQQTRDAGDIGLFYELCKSISEKKKFDLPGSNSIMQSLIELSRNHEMEARLFVARYQEAIAAGVLALRSGKSIHYIWGGSDRRFSKQRVGEVVQWGVIEYALENGLELYDMEGIDPENNPGVYEFKRKLGGDEISLPRTYVSAFGWLGHAALVAGRWFGKI